MTIAGAEAGGAPRDGTWAVHTVDGAEVRLRSGRIGLVSVDVKAPVTGGELIVSEGSVRFTLRLALDQLKTGNFLMQAAARTLVTRNDAHVLTYDGAGAGAGAQDADAWDVTGHAVAGTIDVALQLRITPRGTSVDRMDEIELVGSANLGTVHLPLPGLGTVEDFSFDVDAGLRMRRKG